MTSTKLIGIIGVTIWLILILLIKVRTKVAKEKREKLQREWRQKIEQLADDRSTDPEGLSLDDVMKLFDKSYWQDICSELEKMPAGKRSLRQAIEIVSQDGEGPNA